MNKIKTPYFPKGLQYASVLLIVAAAYFGYTGHPAWVIIMLVLTTLILTTYYVTEFDLSKKSFSDYVSIASIPFQEEKSNFSTLEKIVITKGNYAQTLNSQARSTQLDWSDYTATLIYNEGVTLDLLTRQDKKELILLLKALTKHLQIPVEDQTTSRHYTIDIDKIGA